MAFPHRLYEYNNDSYRVELDCFSCHAPQILIVSRSGYEKWRGGDYIQDALSELDKDRRELLISGICTDCWDKMYGEDE